MSPDTSSSPKSLSLPEMFRRFFKNLLKEEELQAKVSKGQRSEMQEDRTQKSVDDFFSQVAPESGEFIEKDLIELLADTELDDLNDRLESYVDYCPSSEYFLSIANFVLLAGFSEEERQQLSSLPENLRLAKHEINRGAVAEVAQKKLESIRQLTQTVLEVYPYFQNPDIQQDFMRENPSLSCDEAGCTFEDLLRLGPAFEGYLGTKTVEVQQALSPIFDHALFMASGDLDEQINEQEILDSYQATLDPKKSELSKKALVAIAAVEIRKRRIELLLNQMRNISTQQAIDTLAEELSGYELVRSLNLSSEQWRDILKDIAEINQRNPGQEGRNAELKQYLHEKIEVPLLNQLVSQPNQPTLHRLQAVQGVVTRQIAKQPRVEQASKGEPTPEEWSLQQSLDQVQVLPLDLKAAIHQYAKTIQDLDEYTERYLKGTSKQQAARELSRGLKNALFEYGTTCVIAADVVTKTSSKVAGAKPVSSPSRKPVTTEEGQHTLERSVDKFVLTSQRCYFRAREALSEHRRGKLSIILKNLPLHFLGVVTAGIGYIGYWAVMKFILDKPRTLFSLAPTSQQLAEQAIAAARKVDEAKTAAEKVGKVPSPIPQA